MLHTTFDLLHSAGACTEGYRKLAKYLGGVDRYGATVPIPLSIALESNGLDDTLWCLRAVLPEEETARDRIARGLACDYAEHVLPLYEAKYPNDPRPRRAIEVARRYANGEATDSELDAARDDAWAAAWAAADVGAAGAAEAAARAAGAAVWAARDAVWAAAWAARDAAGAARDAAWAAAGAAMDAAGDVGAAGAAEAAAWAAAVPEWQVEALRKALLALPAAIA